MDKSPAQLLGSERDLASARHKALSDELGAIVSSREGDNGDDEHDPEGSTVAFERERVAALRSQASAYLVELEQAEQGLARGDYGRCLSCQLPIGEERLQTLPTTQFCAACAGSKGRRNLA